MDVAKEFIQHTVFAHPENYQWSLQGFGMLRTYLSDDKSLRLHVWNSDYKVPDVSEMHDHPWGFDSYVVVGSILQRRFTYEPYTEPFGSGPDLYMRQTIKCGVGGGLEGEPEQVELYSWPQELYGYQGSYQQRPEEIHVSFPQKGTVTVIKRLFNEDTEHAHVFWRPGAEWVSAEPYEPSEEITDAIIKQSLEAWFI